MDDLAQKQITSERAEIDKIDAEMLELLIKRVGHVEKIGELKHSCGKPIRDKARESSQSGQIIKACGEANHAELSIYILLVFRMIIEGSVRLQGNNDLEVQGPKWCIFCEWKTSGVSKPPLNWPSCPRCHVPLLATTQR